MQYYLEFKDEGSNKFWRLELAGSEFTVTFGKIGTAGQSQQKQFASEEQAKKEAEKLANAKRKKGYADAEPPKDAPVPKPKAAPPKAAAPAEAPKPPQQGPAPVADDGKPKPWHDEDDEQAFALAALAEPDNPTEIKPGPAEPAKQENNEEDSAVLPHVLGDACVAGDLKRAQTVFNELKKGMPEAARAMLLGGALKRVLEGKSLGENTPAVVAWLLKSGAEIPKEYVDNTTDEKYAMPYEGLSKYFFVRYGKAQDPARAKQILAQYLEDVFSPALESLEEKIAERDAFKPIDNKRKNRYRGFDSLLDDRYYYLLGIENAETDSFRSTSLPDEFWPYFYEVYKKDPDLFRLREIFSGYLESAFEEAAGVLAETLRDYASCVRAKKPDEERGFKLASEDGKIGRAYPVLDINTFNEFWFQFYLEGTDRVNAFDVQTNKTAGLVTEFFPKYAALLAPKLEQLAKDGVFDGLFEWGGFALKIKDDPNTIFAWSEKSAAAPFEKTVKELEKTNDWAEDTDAFIQVFPLLIHGVFGAPDEARAFALLERFAFETTDANAEAKVVRKLYSWDDSYARVLYELAVYNNENLHPDRAKDYAQKAERAGISEAAQLLKQLAQEAEARKKLARGEKAAAPKQGFDLEKARREWRNTTYEQAFSENDLYKKTDSIAARARRDGNIYIRFLAEGEQGYSDALDFLNNLLEKGYAKQADNYTDGFALHVRFLIAPEFIPQMKNAKAYDGMPYPRSDAHAFFARAVQYPALREKVKGYAERALNRFDYYLDLDEENGTVPGTFAAVALAFCGKEYFETLSRYALAVDDEHTYILPCVVPPLVKHYGSDPDLAPPLFDITRYSNLDEPFKLPKDLIWSAEFIARLLEYGGADENDTSGLEDFSMAVRGIYGNNTKSILKKAKEFAQSAPGALERAVYTDFYNTYLLAAAVWDEDEIANLKPLGPPKTDAAADASEAAPLEHQDVVVPFEQMKKRGCEVHNEFTEKALVLFSPAVMTHYREIENLKKQYALLAAEGSKDSYERRCTVERWYGPLCLRFGKWAINTSDFPFECGMILYDGKTKPFVLFGEFEALALGIAATKRMPKTPEVAEELRRQHLIAESYAQPKNNSEWDAANAFYDDFKTGGRFLSEWDAAVTKRIIEKITPQHGEIIYLSAQLMLAYMAERRGDAESLAAICKRLAALQPEQKDFWLEKQAAANAALA